jgi:hypothetical protein
MADSPAMPPPSLPSQEKVYEIVGKKRLQSGSSDKAPDLALMPLPPSFEDMDYTLVSNNKRSHSSSSDPSAANSRSSSVTSRKSRPTKKSAGNYPVGNFPAPATTHNSFATLTDDDTHPSDSQPPAPTSVPKYRVTPIVVNDPKITTHKQLTTILLEACPDPGSFTIKPNGETHRITASNIKNYRLLTDILETKSIFYHTFATQKSRAQSFVIRGLALTTNPSDIAEELGELRFNVRKVTQLTKTETGKPTRTIPLFQVWLAPTVGQPPVDLTTLTRLQYCVVTTEHPRAKKPPVIQCFRCQRVGHTSDFCRQPLRCVRCGGEHTSLVCVIPREDATCCNCKQDGHAACYPGCETFKRAVALKKSSSQAAWNTARSATASGGQRPTPRPRLEMPAIDRSVLSTGHNESEGEPQREPSRDLQETHSRSQRLTAISSTRTFANVTSGISPLQPATPELNVQPPTTPADNPLDWKQLLINIANMLAAANIHPILTHIAQLVPVLISLIPTNNATTK